MTRVALVGAGVIGRQHLAALAGIAGVTITCVIDPNVAQARHATADLPIGGYTDDLDTALADPAIDAVILCTPSPLHADQTLRCLAAGKHVHVEVPLATNLADAERVARSAAETGLACTVGHTRRFNAPSRWLKQRLDTGALALRQMVVQTHFLRRSNVDLHGKPRDWTDSLLWHHAAHTVDLFGYLAGSEVVDAQALAGPTDPALGIPLDIAIQLRAANGALCSLSLSFNNEGPQGSFSRYICDMGTYLGRYDTLSDGHGQPIDLTGAEAGLTAQLRDFVAAIHGAPSRASIEAVLPAYRLLDRIERGLRDDG